MREIERRWLVVEPPSGQPSHTRSIWQGYLAVESEHSIRIRRIDESAYFLGIKSLPNPAVALVREETEIELTRRQFEELVPCVLFQPIEKLRSTYVMAGVAVEVDVFSGHLAGLVIAEVEFRSERASDAFVALPWFDIEVTEDRRFLNSELALSEEVPSSWSDTPGNHNLVRETNAGASNKAGCGPGTG